MPKNILAAFLAAGTMGFIGGVLSLTIAGFLFSYITNGDGSALSIFIGFFIDVVGPLFFCTLILLPLSVVEREKIEQKPFVCLVKRYTPLLTIPFGVLFFYALTYSYNYKPDQYFFLVTILNMFGICVFSLWTFLKKLSGHDNKN